MSEYIISDEQIAENQRLKGRMLLVMPVVVRCRDCKHYRPHEFVLITDIEHVCLFWAEGVKVAPDGYCAWGERRSEIPGCRVYLSLGGYNMERPSNGDAAHKGHRAS